MDQAKPSRKLRICLAASGGGHVRQLLDLEPVWAAYDSFFVTEGTALGSSLAKKHRAHFVTHVAMGQARLGKPWMMLRLAWRNFQETRRIISEEKPDIVISTGAGAVYFLVLLARLRGARVILIESFARFNQPSLFMRLAAPLAHHKVVQSQRLANYWPDAQVFDPLQILNRPRAAKEPLLFVTVGATLPFDRMIGAVAQLKQEGEITESIIAQVGVGGVHPHGADTVETIPFDEVRKILKRADIVVCHGGTGSIITALREQCRVIVMPRRQDLREHYDNHQEEITTAFEERGLVTCAKNTDELRAALKKVRARQPVCATTDPQELLSWISGVLRKWETQAAKKVARKRR